MVPLLSFHSIPLALLKLSFKFHSSPSHRITRKLKAVLPEKPYWPFRLFVLMGSTGIKLEHVEH